MPKYRVISDYTCKFNWVGRVKTYFYIDIYALNLKTVWGNPNLKKNEI
jgi:hypothetical protein